MPPSYVLTPIALVIGVIGLLGAVVVSRYSDRSFAVPLARVVLLAAATFMLWVAWISLGVGFADLRLIDYAAGGIGLICTAAFAWAAIFCRGEWVLWWIRHICDGI
jgi:hypothetical protein